jgi:hypothetical protein
MTFKLLTRDGFREGVFDRDGHTCVVCKVGPPAHLDAHHILERKLWADGGYYLENGATVCEEHHREAEATTLSCERLRSLAGIIKFPVPPQLHEEPMDKWGNPILPNGLRLRGELFDDPSVQKILAPVLALFTTRVKYPRTWHLPWSPGVTKDDRVQTDLSAFEGQEIVVTEKLDGENTTLYRDYMHARSLDYEPHPSRSWVRATHSQIAHDIPEGFRICGENLFAKHSIHYEKLASYFQVFSIWNDKNVCLSWDETLEYTALLGLVTVPVLYRGPWDEKTLRQLAPVSPHGDPCEGYVVRVAEAFRYREFRAKALKYVRAGHVQTHGHWMRQTVQRNGLAAPK